MSLEDFLRHHLKDNIIDFTLRASFNKNGDVVFYIHPEYKDGLTRDYVVEGNTLQQNPDVQHLDEVQDKLSTQESRRYPPCHKCGGKVERVIIACPDNMPGCAVLHYGLVCQKCGKIESRDAKQTGAI